MILFIANVVLAVIMASMLAQATLQAILIAMVAAFFLTRPLRNSFGGDNYHQNVEKLLGLTGFFLWDLISSSLKVAFDVLTPELKAKPRFIVVPLDAKTDTEILLTANLISLTPGSLSVDISEDRSKLLVHAMFADGSADEVRQALKDGMERRVIEALR
ncbi:MAG: Na+/H+ antiporter subunit E [Litorivicinus sp.]